MAFLRGAHLLSLCVAGAKDGVIECHCASLYYAFCEENLSLVFKSDPNTAHIAIAKENPQVAANIAKDSANLARLRGLQIKAHFRAGGASEAKIYYRRFPFARLGGGEIFALDILWAKYTDNGLLSGEKLIFVREDSPR